jgi:hypothetical protein
MTRRPDIQTEGLRALAAAADLPLAEGREAEIAAQLNEWLAAANELSAKMSAREYSEILPVTVFRHLPPEDGDNG